MTTFNIKLACDADARITTAIARKSARELTIEEAISLETNSTFEPYQYVQNEINKIVYEKIEENPEIKEITNNLMQYLTERLNFNNNETYSDIEYTIYNTIENIINKK
jgi:hypothetical protein